MNSGMQDSYNLCGRLVRKLRAGEDTLDGYFEERHAVIDRVIAWSRDNHQTTEAMKVAFKAGDMEAFYELAKEQQTHVNGLDQRTGLKYSIGEPDIKVGELTR